MPNIFKAFLFGEAKDKSDSETKVEPYRFPDAAELVVEPEPEEEQPPALELDSSIETDAEPEVDAGPPGGFDALIADPEPEPEPEVKTSPITFAQIQAEEILADARRDAERILKQARDDADREAENVFAKAREEGYQEGYVQGMAQAAEESKQLREEQAQRMEEEVHRFMEHAGVALDRQMDQSVDDLRDLALAVAEKVVCVSLKSSADVISRMIQTAIDKRKKKEWVHIYISECDAKRLSQIPASLSAALSALSDRVRIIPMADDESGTCIIEMPDEIVDASTATQLHNLRTILTDTANSASGITIV
ncbi:MAG: F0F1 ATP synthase subunit delta [Oscillospiraceae bacterium]|nr:F0F1 ATP synthase subunit delta [Oscillospiraceae bacterium]